MSGWTKVGDKPKKNQQEKKSSQQQQGKHRNAKGRPWSEEKMFEFLCTFKTEPCDNSVYHDYRFCAGYHSEKDQRRNPYKYCHDVDESQNDTEKMYHPLMFRTYLCGAVGPTKSTCPFGKKLCANAHSEAEQRDVHLADEQYEMRRTKTTQLDAETPNIPTATIRSVDMFVTTAATPAKRNYRKECQECWRVHNQRPTTVVIPLSDLEWFVLTRSNNFYHYLEEVAFLEGCCTIRCFRNTGGGDGVPTYKMQARGAEADHAMMIIQAIIMSSPGSYFRSETREFTERVMTKLKIQYQNEGQQSFSSSLDVLIEFSGDFKLRVTAVGTTEVLQRQLIASVFDKIDFWTKQEGYNDFHECQCCFDNKNADEGVLCANGHFFCSVEGCLDSAISSQIFHIRSREEWVICPECKVPYDIARVAARVKKSTLINVLKAVIDKSVEKERAVLEESFDRQLKAKTQELFEKYANADETLKLKAKQAALDIRNTILNLSCPHCGIAYAEFSGCMALECSSCKKYFCAYCHFKAGSGRGAHEHVRECLMNETTNGSYYADPVQIKNAQRRYRQRELKKHIRKFKKDEQNAIVIEISEDLKDLDIDPSGLFEVGNLQPVGEGVF